jgi:hypothetical protein
MSLLAEEVLSAKLVVTLLPKTEIGPAIEIAEFNVIGLAD